MRKSPIVQIEIMKYCWVSVAQRDEKAFCYNVPAQLFHQIGI